MSAQPSRATKGSSERREVVASGVDNGWRERSEHFSCRARTSREPLEAVGAGSTPSAARGLRSGTDPRLKRGVAEDDRQPSEELDFRIWVNRQPQGTGASRHHAQIRRPTNRPSSAGTTFSVILRLRGRHGLGCTRDGALTHLLGCHAGALSGRPAQQWAAVGGDDE